jgi:hypothetical protein
MTNTPIPWNTRRRPRAGGREDWPRLAALAGIVLGVLVVGFIAFRWLFGGSCDDRYCPLSFDGELPAGYALASDVYEFTGEPIEIPDGAGVDITVELRDTASESNSLNFFQYRAESATWEPLGAAVLAADGSHVTGRFADTPPVIAVLRRLSAAGNVVAYLQAGDALHPEAAELVTIVHTLDYRPGPEGAVEGQASAPSALDAQHIPSIVASNADTGTVANLDAILADSASRSNHVRLIATVVQRDGLAGIDIMYSDLRADQRDSFALFIEELAIALHTDSRKLTVTLPPPVRSGEVVDEGAYDWTVIGAAADLVQMRPIRDQDTYRADMSAILDYLTARVEPSKLALVVTPLAAEKSTTGVRALSLTDAMGIATKLLLTGTELAPNENIEIVGFNIDRSEELTGLVWDRNTATVAFTYKLEGNRTVWIENLFSVGFKLEFASRYRLGGIGVEDASNDPFLGNIWGAVRPFVETGQPLLLQPNPADLQPQWRASAGTLEGGQMGVVRWTAPAEPGTYTVNLMLSDGIVYFDSEIRLSVQERATDSGGG